MNVPPLPVRWRRREPPLPAAAVAASGAAATTLRTGTLARMAAGGPLRACAGPDGAWLIVLGDPADLPWADGATYLGWDSGVLVPTLAEPWPCADLLREPLRRLTGRPDGLVALLPGLVLAGPLPREPADPRRLGSGD